MKTLRALVLTLPIMGLGLISSCSTNTSQDEIAPASSSKVTNLVEDNPVKRSTCQKAFVGKCTGGKGYVVELGEITSSADIPSYCDRLIQKGDFNCDRPECIARLNVIYGYMALGKGGNFCLPDQL